MDAFIHETVGRTLGTQVDVVVFNMFGFGDAVPAYPTSVPEATRIWLDEFQTVGEWREQVNHKWVIENDPWKEAIKVAHGDGMEFWAGMRFNDIHPRRWKSEFRTNHPEFEMGDRCTCEFHKPDSPSCYFMKEYCKAYDFSIPEVRAHRLALIEEVCSRYDVDGFEWDFTRHYSIHAFPDIQEGVSILTDYMRQVRKVLQQAGDRRGRPLGFGARIPATTQMCLENCIDIEVWIKEDFVDYVSPSPGSPSVTNPFFEDFVDMAGNSNCRIYACTSEQMDGRWLQTGWGPPPASVLRAGATNAWKQGVDGIYLFNFVVAITRNVTAQKALLREVGSLSSLEHTDKLYTVNACYNRPHLQAYTYQMPIVLDVGPSSGKSIHFTVGDDLAKAARCGILDSVLLELIVSEPCGEEAELSLNGHTLPDDPQLSYVQPLPGSVSNVSLTYHLRNGKWINEGENELHVVLKCREPRILSKFTIHELSLKVSYRIQGLSSTI